MTAAPSFDRAEQALEDALASLPLPAAGLVDPEVRGEYVALILFILHTRERLALLAARWEAEGLAVADDARRVPTPLRTADRFAHGRAGGLSD